MFKIKNNYCQKCSEEIPLIISGLSNKERYCCPNCKTIYHPTKAWFVFYHGLALLPLIVFMLFSTFIYSLNLDLRDTMALGLIWLLASQIGVSILFLILPNRLILKSSESSVP